MSTLTDETIASCNLSQFDTGGSIPLVSYILDSQVPNEFKCERARVYTDRSTFTLLLLIKHEPFDAVPMDTTTQLTITPFKGIPGKTDHGELLDGYTENLSVCECAKIDEEQETILGVLKFRFDENDTKYEKLKDILKDPRFNCIPLSFTVQLSSLSSSSCSPASSS